MYSTSIRELILDSRKRLFETEDTLCLERAELVTQAYADHGQESPVIKRAYAFAHILSNMTLDLDLNPVFAGNTSSCPRGWMLTPEYSFSNYPQVLIENDGLDHIMDGIPDEMREFWKDKSSGGKGAGHFALDLNRVVHCGFRKIIEDIDNLENEGTPQQREYRNAMKICLEAVITWAHRFSDHARDIINRTSDKIKIACLERVAEACSHVPELPARNLFEGLQTILLADLALWIEGHAYSVSIASPDRVLEPFIGKSADRDDIIDLLSAFILKLTANSVSGRGTKTQAVTVGGADAEGNDCSNLLTSCFLEAFDRTRVGDPQLFLRWHRNLSSDIKEKASAFLADGLSMPLLVHDTPTAEGMISAGVEEKDAWDYAVIGCNEIAVPGHAFEMACARSGSVIYIKHINEVLMNTEVSASVTDMDSLLSAVENRMYAELSASRTKFVEKRAYEAEFAPMPYTSAVMHGCVEKGGDWVEGLKYSIPGHYDRSLPNGANALAVLETLVFSENGMSLTEFVAEMENGFPDPELQNRIRNASKWGNDDELVDKWGLVLVKMRERVLNRIDEKFGHSGHSCAHVVRSLHHIDGKRLGTTPDGRPAGTPVGDSAGAVVGTAVKGPTAILKTVSKIDASRYYPCGTANLNITLPLQDTSRETVLSLIEGFFNEGGGELQINCLDTDKLKAAQKEPEQYGDMIVRMAGMSARFVDMSKQEQDEIIARSKAI